MTKIKNTKKGMAKKTLSMSLVVAMLATSNVPVWATEFSDGTEATFTSEAETPVAENTDDINFAKGLPTADLEMNVTSTKLSDANANGITVTTNYTVDTNESICLSFVTVKEGYVPTVGETNASVNSNRTKELKYSTDPASSQSCTLKADFTEYVDQTIYCVLYQFDNAAYDREQATALGILPIKVTVDSVSDYYTADASTEQAWGTTLPTVDLSGRTNYNAELSDGAWYKDGVKVADGYTIAQSDINAKFEYKATLNCGNDEFDGETVTVKTITVTGKETTSATATWNGFTTAIGNGGDLSCNYDGTAHQPTISNITLDGTTYSDVKFAYKYYRYDSTNNDYSDTETSDFTSAGKIKVVATVEESSAVLAGTTVTAYLEIKGIDLSTDTTVTANPLVYNGTTSFLTNVTDADKAEDAGLVVTHAGKTLVCGTDYTVAATASDKNAGTEKVTITITGAGNYTGSFAKKVDITAADLSKAEVTVNGGSAVAYTGNQVTPSVTVILENNTLVADTDYTVTYTNNVNVGKDASVTITGKGNYTGSITKTFEIKSSEDSWNEFLTSLNSDVYDGKEISYSGSAVTPVKDSYGTSTVNAIWVKGRDYEVTYSPQNINAGDVKVTITGINNYAGHSQEYTFKIVPVDITNNSDVKVEFPNITYSADLADRKAEIKAAVKVTYKGTELTLNQDYTLGDPVITTDSKTVSIQITGNKNYTGSLTASADVAAKDIAGVTLPKIEAQPYTGSDYAVSIDSNGNLVLQSGSNSAINYQLTDGATPLKSDNYYIVNVVNNKAVGTATINLGGKGNYTGTVSLSFPIINQELTGTIVDSNTGSTLLKDQDYNYTDASSKYGITYNDLEVKDADGNQITSDKYDIAYTENKAVGTATITVTGKEGYNLYAVNTFRITPAKLDEITNHSLSMVTPSEYDYTSEEVKAAYTLKLTDGDYTLVEGTDYKVEYVNNINASEGVTDDSKKPAVKITGLGNYAGKNDDGTDVILSENFTIKKVTLNATDIVAKDVAYAGGLPTTPDVTVTNSKSGKALIAGTDYTVEVTEGGTNVGPVSAAVKLTAAGTNNYILDDSVAKTTYNVTASDLAKAVISPITDQVVTGEQIKPEITVMNGNIRLTENVDYEVSYGENTEIGEGTVTVKALDSNKNYTGSQTVKFNIVKDTPVVGKTEISNVKVVGNKATVILSGEADGASGYDYVISTDKDCTTSKAYDAISKNQVKTSTSFKYVQNGTYYAYCHAWTRDKNGKKVFGEWSEGYEFQIKATTPDAPVITKVTVSGSTIKVTYNKISNIAGYDVVLGTSAKNDNGELRPYHYGDYKILNINKNKVTVEFKNVSKETWTVGMRSFTKDPDTGKKVFSRWSNLMTAKVK